MIANVLVFFDEYEEVYGDFSFLSPRVRMYEGIWRERV